MRNTDPRMFRYRHYRHNPRACVSNEPFGTMQFLKAFNPFPGAASSSTMSTCTRLNYPHLVHVRARARVESRNGIRERNFSGVFCVSRSRCARARAQSRNARYNRRAHREREMGKRSDGDYYCYYCCCLNCCSARRAKIALRNVPLGTLLASLFPQREFNNQNPQSLRNRPRAFTRTFKTDTRVFYCNIVLIIVHIHTSNMFARNFLWTRRYLLKTVTSHDGNCLIYQKKYLLLNMLYQCVHRINIFSIFRHFFSPHQERNISPKNIARNFVEEKSRFDPTWKVKFPNTPSNSIFSLAKRSITQKSE